MVPVKQMKSGMVRVMDLWVEPEGFSYVLEFTCEMTGFRSRYAYWNIGEGFFRSAFLGAG